MNRREFLGLGVAGLLATKIGWEPKKQAKLAKIVEDDGPWDDFAPFDGQKYMRRLFRNSGAGYLMSSGTPRLQPAWVTGELVWDDKTAEFIHRTERLYRNRIVGIKQVWKNEYSVWGTSCTNLG